MLTLKIPQGNFNFSTIASEIEFIGNDKLKDFYKAVMTAESFGNGMKAIITTAESFKPKPLEQLADATTAEAQLLISACEEMNTILFHESNKFGIPFDDYVMKYQFNNLQERTKALLDTVKPHCSHKLLIINIRHYQTSVDAINAFKSAILRSERTDSVLIENKRVRSIISGARV